MSKNKVNFAKLKIAILNGQKNLVNRDGRAVTTISDADLAIEQDQKVVQDKYGTRYLLRKNQDLEQIKRERPHELASLKLAFDEKKHELLSFKASLKEKKSFFPFEDGKKKRTLQEDTINPIIDNEDNQGREEGKTMPSGQTLALTPMSKPTRVSLHIDDYPYESCNKPKPKPEPKQVKPYHQINNQPTIQPARRRPLDARFNLNFINSVYGQALSAESLKIAPFLAFMTDLRMQGMLRNLERMGVDAAKANVADLDFAYELRSGATYPTPLPTQLRPEPK